MILYPVYFLQFMNRRLYGTVLVQEQFMLVLLYVLYAVRRTTTTL